MPHAIFRMYLHEHIFHCLSGFEIELGVLYSIRQD